MRIGSNRNSHLLVVRMQNGTVWKTIWQFPTKLNTLFPYDPAVVLLHDLPKRIENIHVHKNLYECLYQFIHKFQKSEATNMSFSISRQ